VNDPLSTSLDRVRGSCGAAPFDLAVILGSGLGACAGSLSENLLGEIPYAELPILPQVETVAGHRGLLQAACFRSWRLLLFQGRFHLYQGLSARQASLPVRLAAELGCRRLLLTNASGGINERLSPGDLLYLSDHLNLMGDNPLRGEAASPFVDLCGLYDQRFFEPLARRARQAGRELRQGVLCGLPGPSYETPAEIAALGRLGADAVSMSTIPEAILARYCGMKVVALSLIANRAAGLAPGPLEHREVLQTAASSEVLLRDLLRILVELWQAADTTAG